MFIGLSYGRTVWTVGEVSAALLDGSLSGNIVLSVETVGDYAFDSAAIESVSGDAVKTLGYSAFSHAAIRTASFKNVATIPMVCFQHCSSLASATFDSATSIVSSAFYYCTALDSLTLGAPTVCELQNTDAFYQTHFWGGTGSIYVPAALVDSYKAATNWARFADLIKAIPEA